MEFKICIICRLSKLSTDFNDEHVIPDSVNGYYHIKSVCTQCNCTLSKADSKLTNHQFIEFKRHELEIAGKKGKIPNPFAGTHTLKDDSQQKLRFEPNRDGQFEITLIPNVPNEISQNFNIVIDAKEEYKSDSIIKKFLERKGLSLEQVSIQTTKSTTERPWIEASMVVDTRDFKMAILKMLYEFAVDSLPEYYNDLTAIHLSKVLLECDFINIYDNVKFIGDGFTKDPLSGLSHFIDFENDNHYLILFDSPEVGLIGYANIFNVFHLGIVLSEKFGLLNDSLLVGKNDLDLHIFEKLSLSDIFKRTYSSTNYSFQYFLPDDAAEIQAFRNNESHPEFDFYQENGMTPLYGRDGNIRYSNIDVKLNQPHLYRTQEGDTINNIVSQIEMDEDLYVRLLPVDKLYQILIVRTEETRTCKI